MEPPRKCYEMDIISKLPLCIIETILCLLPIQEAARTSILSKEWRYHWIKIPKLALIEETFQVFADSNEPSVLEQTVDGPNNRNDMNKRSKHFYAINQVLLNHRGPIHEFTLSMDGKHCEDINSCNEIDHILNQLSQKKTVKILTLDTVCYYKLPISLFSFCQLTDLYISSCALDHLPTCNKIRNLTSLFLQELRTDEKTLMRLLSSCPKLKSLNLCSNCSTIEETGDSTIADLFECLPMVENLSISFHIILCFVPEKGIPKVLPTALVQLKYICMDIAFLHKYGYPFLFLLIKSSPNLEKLRLEMFDDRSLEDVELGSCKLEDYSNIWLEHLNELEITSFLNTKNELDFVKLIFAKSPVLKKVRIYLDNEVDEDQASETSRILQRSPRASPFEFTS